MKTLDFVIRRKTIKFEKGLAFKHRVIAMVWIGLEQYELIGHGDTKVDAMASLITSISNKQYQLMNREEVA